MTRLSPEEMIQKILEQRGWTHTGPNQSYTDKTGPLLGDPYGLDTHSFAQVTDNKGKVIAHELGAHLRKGSDVERAARKDVPRRRGEKGKVHAERMNIGALDRRLAGVDVRGGTLEIAVDQIPCDPEKKDCIGHLVDFCKRKGLKLKIYLPEDIGGKYSFKGTARRYYSGKIQGVRIKTIEPNIPSTSAPKATPHTPPASKPSTSTPSAKTPQAAPPRRSFRPKLPGKIRFHPKILKSAGRAIGKGLVKAVAMFWLDIIEIGLGILKSYFEEKYIQALFKSIENQINSLAEQRFNQAFESGEITKLRFGKELEGGYQLYFKIEINAYRLPFILKGDQQVAFDLIFDGNTNTHEFIFFRFDLSDIKIVRQRGTSKFPDVNNNSDFKNYPNVILYNEIFETGEILTEGSEDAANESFNIIQNLVYNPFSVNVNYTKGIPVPGTTMMEDKRRGYVRDFRAYSTLFPLSKAAEEWKKLSTTADGKPRLEFEKMMIGLGFLNWEESFHFAGRFAVEILNEPGVSWAMEVSMPIKETAKRELWMIGSRDFERGRQLYEKYRQIYDSVTLPEENTKKCGPQNREIFRQVVRPWGQRVVEELRPEGWRESPTYTQTFREEILMERSMGLFWPKTIRSLPTFQPKPASKEPVRALIFQLPPVQQRYTEYYMDRMISGQGNDSLTPHDLTLYFFYEDRYENKILVDKTNIIEWAKAGPTVVYPNIRNGRIFVAGNPSKEKEAREYWYQFLKSNENLWKTSMPQPAAKIIYKLNNGVTITSLNYKEELKAYIKAIPPSLMEIYKNEKIAFGFQLMDVYNCLNSKSQYASFFYHTSQSFLSNNPNSLSEKNIPAFRTSSVSIINSIAYDDLKIEN